MSSLRSLTRTSVGNSGCATATPAPSFSAPSFSFSIPLPFPSPSAPSSPLSRPAAAPSAPSPPSRACACAPGLGVAARLNASSSPTTNSGSNSAGSGPLPSPPASLDLDDSPCLVLTDGESVRAPDRFADDEDREGDCDGGCSAAFWRACSSAMRESMAPLRRWAGGEVLAWVVWWVSWVGRRGWGWEWVNGVPGTCWMPSVLAVPRHHLAYLDILVELWGSYGVFYAADGIDSWNLECSGSGVCIVSKLVRRGKAMTPLNLELSTRSYDSTSDRRRQQRRFGRARSPRKLITLPMMTRCRLHTQ